MEDYRGRQLVAALAGAAMLVCGCGGGGDAGGSGSSWPNDTPADTRTALSSSGGDASKYVGTWQGTCASIRDGYAIETYIFTAADAGMLDASYSALTYTDKNCLGTGTPSSATFKMKINTSDWPVFGSSFTGKLDQVSFQSTEGLTVATSYVGFDSAFRRLRFEISPVADPNYIWYSKR